MTEPKDQLSRKEAAAFALLQANRAWTICKFVMWGVAVFSGAFLYCMITGKGRAAMGVSGGLDALLGVCFRQIIKYHFPEKDEPLLLRLLRSRGTSD